MRRFEVRTTVRQQFVEITDLVREAVAASGIAHGICIVYVPHTTAAVTVNENADPDVVHDMTLWLNRVIPQDQPGFRHGEGNSDAHLKASLIGSSVTLVIDQGSLVLGRWQGVYFVECDGPRRREVIVQAVGS